MNETVALLNTFLALGGIGVFLSATILLIDYKTSRVFASLIARWGMLLALFLSLGAVAMTLLYSEVFGFVPCGLCWLQRVALYPQVVIAGLAIFYHEQIAARYGLVLSVLGAVVALYQHYLQMGGAEFIACPTSGSDCSKRIMFEFGFVTFPLLSAFLFIFLIVLYFYILRMRD